MNKKAGYTLRALSLFCIMMFGIAPSVAAKGDKPVVLKGGILIDGTGSPPVEDVTVGYY